VVHSAHLWAEPSTRLVLDYLKLFVKDFMILSLGEEKRAKTLSAFAVDFREILTPCSVFAKPTSIDPPTKKLLNLAFN